MVIKQKLCIVSISECSLMFLLLLISAPDKTWFQIMDMTVLDRNAYMVDYVPGHQDLARNAGATLAVGKELEYF